MSRLRLFPGTASINSSKEVVCLPKTKQVEKPEAEEVKQPEEPSPAEELGEIPTLSSLIEESLAPASTAEEVEEPEPEPIVDPAQLTLNYLMRKDKEKSRLVKETLRALPELAKSGDPLAVVMLEKILQSGQKSGDIEELKDLAKAMSYTVILPEMMRDIMREVRGKKEGGDQITMILLKELEERDRRLQELMKEIKEERESKLLDEVRKEFYDNLSQVVQVFQQSLEELRAQISTAAAQSPTETSQSDPLDMIDKFIEYENKFRELLMKRGYRVVSPEELLEKYSDAKELDIEKEIKLKELQLKEKEIEAKKSFYDQLGAAIAKLTENPDNLIRLVNGILSILRGGPSNKQWAGAAGLGGMTNVLGAVSAKPKIPSFEDFVTGGEQGGGQGSNEGS